MRIGAKEFLQKKKKLEPYNNELKSQQSTEYYNKILNYWLWSKSDVFMYKFVKK